MGKNYLQKFEEYESNWNEDDESFYHDDDYLFGRPNYTKKPSKKQEKEDNSEYDYDDESESDMDNLLYLLRTYFENQGIEVDLENDGLDITIQIPLNKKESLKNIIDVFSVVKKVKRDILPQYDSEFELWYAKDGSPLLCFNFDYEEGLSDDNPF